MYNRKILYLWLAITLVWVFLFLFIIAFHQELGLIKQEISRVPHVTELEELRGKPPHEKIITFKEIYFETKIKYTNTIQFFLSASFLTKLSYLLTPPLSIIFLVYLIDQIIRLIKLSLLHLSRYRKEKYFKFQEEESYHEPGIISNEPSAKSTDHVLPLIHKNINYGDGREIPIPTNILNFSIYTEKKTDEGEDARPLISSCGDGKLVGIVFDGLGGAGSSKITTLGGVTKTQAYYASRIVRDFFSDICINHTIDTLFVKNVMQSKLTQYMQAAVNNFTFPETQIITKRASQLPTTLAGFYADVSDKLSPKATIFWAGDSRCYFLDETNGLIKLTKDDHQYEGDEYESLKTDSPMSNCIDASGNFKINSNTFKLSTKNNILIAVTDGCFNYFETPIHFKYMLLKTLSISNNLSQWQSKIQEQIIEVTQDDATMALVATGWNNFNEIKDTFKNRLEEITSYIAPIEGENLRIVKLKEDLQNAQNDLNKIKLDTWKKYTSSRK